MSKIHKEIITAPNTQAAKDLQSAKDKARELESQLEEAKNNETKFLLEELSVTFD